MAISLNSKLNRTTKGAVSLYNKGAHPLKRSSHMKYKQLDYKMKAQIDILLASGHSMRAIGEIMNISHSTVSRYKNNVYSKREVDIYAKYQFFIEYLLSHYDRRTCSIEVCLHKFKRYHPTKPCVSVQQVYNWINEGKINISPTKMCYKRRKRKKRSNGMMNHVYWNIEHHTELPIALRPNSIETRDEIGHLEIDSIIGKRNEYDSIISIVDRCSRMVWLIKAEYNLHHYIKNLIYRFIVDNKIPVKSITTDNGLEFQSLSGAAKKLGVKLYKCDPYCSFQRGSNEHMNGIVRRFIPKGTSMRNYEQQYLDDICFKINSMPRKIFDFKTPFEIDFKKSISGAVEI